MEQELATILSATLSPDSTTRKQAEASLEQAFQHPDVGIALTRMGLAEEADETLRQITIVTLKRYVSLYWHPYFSTFIGPPPSHEIKNETRTLLVQGLSVQSRKLRTAFAFVISTVAHSDWPDEFPTLMDSLLSLLKSGSPEGVHGAMRVFTEFVRADVDEQQLLPVTVELSPVLLGILGDPARHSPITRARTIAVFRQCVETLYMVKEEHPVPVNTAIKTIVPNWLSAFATLLSIDPRDEIMASWESIGIRLEIFRTLQMLQNSFPKVYSKDYYNTVFNLSIHHLTTLHPVFIEYYVSSSSDSSIPAPTNDEGSDGNCTLPQLASSIVDLISMLSRSVRSVKLNQDQVEGIMKQVLEWTQMTTEDEENWESDPNAFVAEEDNESDLYTLRIACHDLASTLLEKYSQSSMQCLNTLVQFQVGLSTSLQSSGNPDWWKPLEAALACVGAVADSMLEVLERQETEGKAKWFDLSFLFDQVIPRFLGAIELQFLQGRSFIVASQYASALSDSLAGQYLDAAVQVLEASSTSVSVKISAVKTIKNFCSRLSITVIKPFSRRILSSLAPLIMQASEEVLALVLECLRAVLGVDPSALDDKLTGQLATGLLEVWAKNVKDPLLCSIFEDIFTYLASNPNAQIYISLLSHTLPKLSEAISAPATDAETSTSVSGALELISSLLRGRKGKNSIGEGFVENVAPGLFGNVLRSEDVEVVQLGTELLTLLVRKDCAKILQWTDATGSTGLQHTFALLSKLLAPGSSESAGLFFGDLLTHLFRSPTSFPLLQPVLPDLLNAVISRLGLATYATFQQSLTIPLAYLIYSHPTAVIPMIRAIEIPATGNGLDTLLKSWCENAETFQGSWAIRVSVLALAELFARNEKDHLDLMKLGVRGEMVLQSDTQGVIMTRSLAKQRPIMFTTIAFPLKALKLILAELKNASASSEYNAAWDAGAENSDDEDEDGDDWEDETPALRLGTAPSGLGVSDKWLSDFVGDLEGEGLDADEDEDLMEDEISTMDIQARLIGMTRESFATMDGFSSLIDGLTEEERNSLGRILG